FILEKSTNGISFSTVANVASNSATSNNNDYSAVDKTHIAGTNYYRVKGIDRDGKETISSILPVTFNLSKQEELSIFPNPSTKLIKVQYYATNQQPITLSVISNLGKTELSKVIQPQIGLNELPLDVTTLPTGVYYLKVFNTTFNKSTKFIKN
ncbi:MAG: T9SS type A sorting domain-containing protein, partial [Pedobacter sp.]